MKFVANDWKNFFSDKPIQEKIARALLENGLRIEGRKIFCGKIEVKHKNLAKAIGCDRRAVNASIATIMANSVLKKIFSENSPAGSMLKNAAKYFEWNVIEIQAESKKSGLGILAKVATVLADKKIAIKQAYASDPELNEFPTLTIIAHKKISGRVVNELLAIPGVIKVSVY